MEYLYGLLEMLDAGAAPATPEAVSSLHNIEGGFVEADKVSGSLHAIEEGICT